MIKIVLILLVGVVYCIHFNHNQIEPRYNSTNYLSDLQIRQDKFTNDIELIKK
jgi:hypothetical protein